jgi:hypothetical protein
LPYSTLKFSFFLSQLLCYSPGADATLAFANNSVDNTQTMKDGIVRLQHLHKDPVAQVQLKNLYGVLIKAQLDGTKTTGQLSEAPLS